MSTTLESNKEEIEQRKIMDYTFREIEGERFVCIDDLEAIPTFFVSMVSAKDHWFFAATNGALSAGRGSPERALFPYYTVDKIINNANCTGPQTLIKVNDKVWEPFKLSSERCFSISRKIYKSINGDTLIFEESNLDFGLKFSYTWSTSEKYGFVRKSKLVNLKDEACDLVVIDGLADFLASGVDDRTQLAYSCLTDAYKVSELDTEKQLLVHRMVASLVDEAIPLECLKATTLWSYGWEDASILINQSAVEPFLKNPEVTECTFTRGNRGCFYKAGQLKLEAKATETWAIVADIDKTQSAVARLSSDLSDKGALWQSVQADILKGREALEALIQASDGLQVCSEEIVSTYHRANVLFNIMRGGVFADNYQISKSLLKQHLNQHNRTLSADSLALIEGLNDSFTYNELSALCDSKSNDFDLKRICYEYLPLVFSRRHGDPSRPWNRFKIQTEDSQGNPIVGFQGNWRDIFQNWEALAWSFPYYNEAFIYKFLNASTADGYNPYRITDSGIEWEEPDPNDPWASIGYWGDHQIIYLLKLLEFTESLKTKSFNRLLCEDHFVFADVPYEIKDFDFLEVDPNHSIHFNEAKSAAILQRYHAIGADGKLVHDAQGQIVRANLFEKLFIPLAVKLSNYVPNGGIWMNTQRPEWNDANNALAGFGLSMVTTYYIHRYLEFFEMLLERAEVENLPCFDSLKTLLENLSAVFSQEPESFNQDGHLLYKAVKDLGLAGEQYRSQIYAGTYGAKASLSTAELKEFLVNVRRHLKQAIQANLRSDGLYHAYNILHIDPKEKIASIEHLGPMLEGQVAVLSSKAIAGPEAVSLLEALRKSPLFCEQRKSYILYADKRLPAFLDYNRIESHTAKAIPLLAVMIEQGDKRIIEVSPDGCYRFNSSIRNRFELKEVLDQLSKDSSFKSAIAKDEQALFNLYEATFNHKAFTGRSGSMFAYEGLGSIYWHMVSKLMLAVQEIALAEANSESFKALVSAYYDVQEGLGFRKKASEYGAFTADAYSHTPSFAGAQQPGLTGMVKEGIICRFNELGVRFNQGTIVFRPELLKRSELLTESVSIECMLANSQTHRLEVPKDGLLFTIAQVPVLYMLTDTNEASIEIAYVDGRVERLEGDVLNQEISESLFSRQSKILSVTVEQPSQRFID